MLPNESISQREGSPQRQGVKGAKVEAMDSSSVLARPHSRQVAAGTATKAVKQQLLQQQQHSAIPTSSGLQRNWSPPRLRDQTVVAPSTAHSHAARVRSESPLQNTVRTIGNAIVNPHTVFTSRVTQSLQTTTISSRASEGSPNRSRTYQDTARSLLTSPLKNTMTTVSDVSIQLASVALARQEVEVFGMERLRQGYGTTSDDVPNDVVEGCRITDLLPDYMPQPDLRRLDLQVQVPRHGITAFRKPVIALQGSVELKIDVTNGMSAEALVYTYPFYVARVIDVQETGLDRAISYQITVDVKEMFSNPPHIDVSTGDLRFALNPLATGSTKCHLVAEDFAMINVETGEVAMSDPLTFVVTVNRVKGTPNSPTSSPIIAQPPKNIHVSLATEGDFATTMPPQEILKQTAQAPSDAPYVFPASNPHELRYYDVHYATNLWIGQHPQVGNGQEAAVEPDLYQPCFDSVLTDLELIRLGRASQERERISGEAVKDEHRAELETKLVDRIRCEEQRLGSDSMELAPLLLRLAQVYIAQGSKKQGDAVELLERICRLRMTALGVSSFDDLDHIQEKLAGNLNGSMTRPLNGTFAAADALNSSMFSSAAAALSEAQDEDKPLGEIHQKEMKKFEALQQSLLLLTLYLKAIGRYHEALDFASHAANSALSINGDGSIGHLRALSEVAEINYLLGNYKEARPLLEKCVARSEVLFGTDSNSTLGLMHSLGICCAEQRDFTRSMQCHDKVLRARQKASNPLELMFQAEAFLLAAWARVQSGNKSPAVTDRVTEYFENASGIIQSMDSASLSPHVMTTKCALLTLMARVAFARHDVERSLTLLQRVGDEISASRGFESLEAAVLAIPHCAVRLSRHCWGWVPQGDKGTVPEENEVARAVRDLQFSASVLLVVLGQHHPYAMRCSALLAEARMFQNTRQSSQTIDRCLATCKALLHPSHRDQCTLNLLASKAHLILRENKSALVEASAAHAVALELNYKEDSMVRLESNLLGAMTRTSTPPSPALLNLLDERVRSFVSEYGETGQEVIKPLQNLAEAYFLLEDFPRAHHYLSRALKIADAVNFIFLLGHLLKPVAQLSIGDVQERNRIARDRINTKLALTFAEILFQIAAVFDTEGKAEDAQSTYLQSLAAQEISGVSSGLSIVQTLSSLAALLYSEGHFGDALAYAEKAFTLTLENFSSMKPVLDAVGDILHAINFRLRCNGYNLLRHPDSRHRFTTYV